MASTNGSGSNAKKAAFEAAYAALKAGKQPSQAEINKIYNQALNQTNKNAGAAVQNTHYSAVDKATEMGNYRAAAKETPASAIPNTHYSVTNNWINRDKNQLATATTPLDDGRTTQQKYDDAKKAYDSYLASDEYNQKLNRIGKRLMRDDTKTRELNATVEHYRQQLQAEEDQRVMDADLKELESWSEEDRNNLDRYIAERNQHAYNSLNPMLDVQFDTYNLNPIVEKYGLGKVRKMAEAVQRSQNAEAMSQVEEIAKETANNRPWLGGILGSTASIPANFAGALTGPLGYVVEAGQRTGRYSTLDPNNIGNLPSVYGQTVRNEVAQNIQGDEENTNWLRKLAAMGYQGAMSAADSGVRMLASGGSAGISAALASSGAFSNGLRQYSQQGASPEQAAAMALTSAGLEYITEKLPTEKVLKMFQKGNTKGAVREVLKQAFLVEPTSEEVNLFAGVAAEAVILGEKSSAKQQIGEMVANGMSYEEARAQYYKGLWSEALQTYAVSAFSGLVSSGGAAIIGNAVNNGQQTETQQQAAPAAPVVDDKTQAQQVIEATAADLAQNAPAPAPKAPLTEDWKSVENAIASVVQNAMQGDGQISNKTAEAILNNPLLLQKIMEGSNIELGNTKAENRRAVKDAVANLSANLQAQQQTETMTEPEIADNVAIPDAQPSFDVEEVKGTGAAEQNFSGKAKYQDLLYEGNVQRDRPGDVRPMELPLTDAQGGNVSAVTGNVYGSKITTDELASLMEVPTTQGDFSYMPISNDRATEMAVDTIAHAGSWENAFSNWKEQVVKGNAGAEMSARGALLLNQAAKTGNKDQWLNTLRYMQKLGTNTAQGLQAMRLIRNLAPPDKISFMQATVNDLSQELGLDNDLTIDPSLLDEFENAKTDEERDEVVERIQENVAKQIPSTWLDKWTALRYTNMLGNLKTQVRNTAGNIGSAVMYRIKDTIATGMEAIASKVSGGKINRTKSLYVSKELRDACKKDFQQVKKTISGGGKFGERMSAADQFTQGIQDKRRIFKSNAENAVLRTIGDIVQAPMEGYRRATNWMMNNQYFGDEAFGRAAYARALAGYLKANGVTGSDLSKVDSTLMNKARSYAIREAQEATFRDNSKLAQAASKLQKASGVVGQGISPFTKTPANVLTRAEEFSPLGLVNSTVMSIQKARGNTEITGADIINSWAKSFTGVGLAVLGAAMMDSGMLIGGPDEDEEKEKFDKLNGTQNYAIQLPNGENYTLDWLTPAAMPLFMGAQFWKLYSEDRDVTLADGLDVMLSIADPMIQMSMLQGLNDTLDSVKYSDNNLGQFLINACVSYLTQGLTNTLMGQLERSKEEHRQTTFVDKDSEIPAWLQKQLGKASQKIPGWDFQQMDYRNAWGEKEENEGGLLYNMLSPGYLSKEQSSEVSDELYRIRKETGANVFPQSPEKSLTYTDKNGQKHEKYNLTAEEYETMQKVEGQTAANILQSAISSKDYRMLTDAQKANVIALAYDYAREHGRVEAIADYGGYGASWMQNIQGKEAQTIVNKVVSGDLDNAMGAVTEAWKNGFNDESAKAALETAFQVYDSMSDEAKKEIRENAGGRVEHFLNAMDKGVDGDTFVDLYKFYWQTNESNRTAGEKAQQWAFKLERAQETGKITQAQKNTLKKEMNFVQVIPAEAKKFDELTSSGLSATDAQSVGRTVSYLMPEEGYKQVRDIQVIEQIAKMTLDDISKDAAMRSYMTDKQEEKFDTVVSMGYSPEEYAQIYRIIDGYTSGTGKKARTIAYLQDEYGISYGTAKALYEVFK